MKKIKLFALAAFAMLSTNAFAAPTKVATGHLVDGLLYDLYEDGTTYTATLLGASSSFGTGTTATVPASITTNGDKTYKVTDITDDWMTTATTGYKDISGQIKTLTMNIDNLAAAMTGDDFDAFTALESLVIVDANTKTKTTEMPAAGAALTTVTSVTLSAQMTNIAASAFTGWTALATVTSTNLKVIGANAFDGCTKLKTIDLTKVEEIGAEAFLNAGKDDDSNITSLTIPATVKVGKIGANAFKGMTKLETVTINNNNLTAVGAWFVGDAAIKSVAITSTSITSIAAGAFASTVIETIDLSGATALTTLTATSFGTSTALKSLKLEGTKINDANFLIDLTGCAATLEEVTFSKDAGFTTVNGTFTGFTALAAVSLPANVVVIGDDTFNGCTALLSAEIKGAAALGDNVFDGCSKLATVTISGAITAIGDESFKGCDIATIDLSKAGAAFTTLNDNLFENCAKLATITLPEGLTTIGDDVFTGTILSALNAPNVVAIGDAFGLQAGGKTFASLKTLVLGKTAIASSTFEGCTELTTVTMGQKAGAVSEIDDDAFKGCVKLTEFNYDATKGDKLYVSNEAFNGCTPWISFNTSNIYSAAQAAPKNCRYSETSALTVKTVADKGASGKYFMYYKPTVDVYCKTADAKVYSVYVDTKGGVAYLQALKVSGEDYNIPANAHVIFKTDAAAEVSLYYNDGAAYAALPTGNGGDDNIFTVTADTEYAAFMAAATGANADVAANATFATFGNYVYRLENPSGNGFGFYSYTKTLKKGQFFVLSKNAPAAGRLNIVWLDENGNVENEATAINSVKKAQNNGAIYNLAGQKVNAAYKGVVIKDGKKYIQK